MAKTQAPAERSTTTRKASKYTDPELREKLKKKIKKSDKGGKKGQWSARKAQRLVTQYEKRGGGYTTPQKDSTQEHLTEWGHERWQTEDGATRARHGDTTERYLPEEAWKRLSAPEKGATQRTKRKASKAGKQHVPNTPAAADAGRAARQPLPGYDRMSVAEVVEALEGRRASTVRKVLDHERAHRDRVTLVRRLERRLG